jgi:hypothetical protein
MDSAGRGSPSHSQVLECWLCLTRKILLRRLRAVLVAKRPAFVVLKIAYNMVIVSTKKKLFFKK